MDNSNQPIRCFEGTAQPHEPFWILRDAVDDQDPEIEFNGYISEFSWFDDDITPQKFKDDLYRVGKEGPVTIRMTSWGGDVIAASLLNTILRDYPGKVTVQIDGIAASAATVVAVAGDEVRMQETAFFMIHDPSFVFFMAQINLEQMERMAASLKAVKEGIINAYETKTGLSRSRLAKLMTEETWMDAQKAVDLGFVDQVVRAGPKLVIDIPENTAIVNALNSFKNVPPALLAAVQPFDVPPTAESSEPLLTEDMQREAQILRETVQTILQKEEVNA